VTINSSGPEAGLQTAGDVERAVLNRFILCLPLDDEGNTALHLACEFGAITVVEELISHCTATQANMEKIAFALDALARSVLAVRVSDFDLAWLHGIDLPCDINARTAVGWTPLHCACNAANLRAIKRLCQAGADASLVTDGGSSSPLHYLAKSDLFEAAPSDLKSSSRTVLTGQEPAVLAHLRADEKRGGAFRAFFDSFAPSDEESLPAEVLVLLQKAGNHIDAANSNGETPLQLACMAGLGRNVAVLLQQGANVFSVSARGHTPLDYAEHRAGSAKDDPIVNLLRAMEKHLTGFLDTFPHTVFLEIFSYLEPRQLARCAMVCRVFRDVAYDNMLWERFVPEKVTAPADGYYAAEFRAGEQDMTGLTKFPAGRIGHDMVSWRGVKYPNADPDKVLRIATVGDSGVGKSCSILRFADYTFPDAVQATIGVDFKIVNVMIKTSYEPMVRMHIWDTGESSGELFVLSCNLTHSL
jgi:ankyrin repeat protein